MSINIAVSGLGAGASVMAAIFWLWASLGSVPDNQDTFIAALQRASYLNSFAAGAASVAALCATVLFARQLMQ